MTRRAAVIILAILIAGAGCESSRKITRRSELADPVHRKPITIYAKDHRLYQLSSYILADSVIRGVGTVRTGREETPFRGEVPLGSIIAIEANSKSFLKGLVYTGAAGMFVAAVVSGTNGGNGLSGGAVVEHHYPSGGDGSSCPYVYSWNGERFVLEAEPFGVGLGKALELTTFHILPSARAEDGTVRIRLTNERRETHYVNSLALHAIDAGTSAAVVLDGDGTAWPVERPQAPVAAVERSGRSILSEVSSHDGWMWECDAADMSAGSGYEDLLEIEFARPGAATDGSLILTGINTTLSTAVFSYLCRVVGDQALALTHAIDTDPDLIARLRSYLDDASLKVSIWNGNDWEEQGSFRPEANAVSFSRDLRIHLPAGAEGTVRVRLRSMADVWKIDSIEADWTPARPLPARRLDLLTAVGPEGEDLRPLLDAGDDLYAVLFPPDQVELSYAVPQDLGAGKIVFAVAGRGYLHEWIPEQKSDAVSSLAAMVPPERRIDFVKELLKHRDIALQPVYEEWTERARDESANR